MINKFIGIGRLTKDVELRTTSSGKDVATFNIAISRDFKKEDGTYETDFINCIAFNQNASYLAKYSKKGDLIAISGKVQTRIYEKDDKKNYITEIIVDSISLLSPKQTNENKKINKEIEGGSSNPFEEMENKIQEEMELPFDY